MPETPQISVLVVEDEPSLLKVLERYLASRGHKVVACADANSAIREVESKEFDVALVDFVLPGMNGLDLLRHLRRGAAPPEFVVMTGEGSVDTAITAVRLGAYDYIPKPYQLDEIDLVVQRAAEKRRLERENMWLQAIVSRQQPDAQHVDALVAESAVMRAAVSAAEGVARTRAPALVIGERGSGATRFAQLIHDLSGAEGPFLCVDAEGSTQEDVDAELFGTDHRGASARFAAGTLQLAQDGTVFIRNIHALSPTLQSKLLAALTSPGARARVVGGTARNVAFAASTGAFSAELFELFGANVITLPPLRERAADIPLLAEQFLQRFAGTRAPKLASDAMQALMDYSWPGNVRELRNVMERVAMFDRGGIIWAADLPIPKQPTPESGVPLVEMERRHIESALRDANWHQGNAAAALGISAKTLYRRIREFGLTRPEDETEETAG